MPPLLSHSSAPFLRLVIPLSCGIFIQEHFNIISFWPYILLTGIICISIPLFRLSASIRFNLRHLFGIGISILVALLGAFIMNSHNISPSEMEEESCQANLCVLQDPVKKSNSLQITAKLLSIRIANSTINDTTLFVGSDSLKMSRHIYVPQKVLLYMPLDSVSEPMHAGSLLIGNGRIQRIRNNGNPDEFDYSDYLHHKEIHYSIYINSYRYIQNKNNHDDYRSRAINLRDKILNYLKKLLPDSESFAFASAISLGYRNLITDEQRDLFAQTGLSHILAVSGLHTGIIFLLVMILLWPLRILKLQKAIYAITILIMWMYAYLTGLPASVVRAVCMISILLTGNIVGERNWPINSLLLTAFLMLIIQPHYLFDVGFQLSFLAVLSILLYQPYMQRIVVTSNPILKRSWELLSVTISAQILTLPISVFYFHTFPVWFMLSNLIIIPILPIYLSTVILGLVFGICGILPAFTQFVLSKFTQIILWIIHLFGQLPTPSQTNEITFDGWMLVIIYLLTAFITLYIINRKPSNLIATLTVVFIFIIGLYIKKPLSDNEIIIFNQNKFNSIHLFENKQQYIFCRDSSFHKENIEYTYRNYCLKRDIQQTEIIQNDTIIQSIGSMRQSFFNLKGIRFFLINDNQFARTSNKYLPEIDYLLVGGKYYGNLQKLQNTCRFKELILLPSLTRYRREMLTNEAQEANVLYYDINKEGALRIPIR